MTNPLHELELAWQSFVDVVERLLILAPEGVTIEVLHDRYGDDYPYVQTLAEDDEEEPVISVEAASYEFVPQWMGPDARNTLGELGWREPDDDGIPNFWQLLKGDDARPRSVANLLVRTLKIVFLAQLTDTFAVSPDFVMEELLEERSGLPQSIDFLDMGLRFRFN